MTRCWKASFSVLSNIVVVVCVCVFSLFSSLVKYSVTCNKHDPFLAPCLPSNPWVTDDVTYWLLNMAKWVWSLTVQLTSPVLPVVVECIIWTDIKTWTFICVCVSVWKFLLRCVWRGGPSVLGSCSLTLEAEMTSDSSSRRSSAVRCYSVTTTLGKHCNNGVMILCLRPYLEKCILISTRLTWLNKKIYKKCFTWL